MVRQFNKDKISITLDHDIYEKVEAKAEKEDRSVSSMINVILRDYFKEKEQK
jgi:metal-responsive CopG/Arc/MetJ family transcriptional regulator